MDDQGKHLGLLSLYSWANEFPAVVYCCRQRDVRIDFGPRRRAPDLREEALHSGRAEDHDSSTTRLPHVPARVNDIRRNVDRLSRPKPRAPAADLHLEHAREHMDRLGGSVVQVGRQRPANGWLVDQQAERTSSVLCPEVYL